MSVRKHGPSKRKNMVGNASQAALVKHLPGRRDQLGNLMLRTRHHQHAVWREVIVVIRERFARQYVCLGKAHGARQKSGIAHRLHGNDSVIAIVRSAHETSAVLGDQVDFRLFEKPSPVGPQSLHDDLVDYRIDLNGCDRRCPEGQGFQNLAASARPDDENLGVWFAHIRQASISEIIGMRKIVPYATA